MEMRRHLYIKELIRFNVRNRKDRGKALMIGLNYTFGIHSVRYSIFHIPGLKVNSRQGKACTKIEN